MVKVRFSILGYQQEKCLNNNNKEKKKKDKPYEMPGSIPGFLDQDIKE